MTRLAPQPDGVPPLLSTYYSEKLRFNVKYPYGAENVQYGPEEFAKDGVESQARVKIDQPLVAIKVTVHVKEKDQLQLAYANEFLGLAQAEDAEVRAEPSEVALDGGTFVTAAYVRQSDDGKLVHRVYIAGLGSRALVFDFMLHPEDAELGEKYAEKIMRSFEPGAALGVVMEKAPPTEEDTAKADALGNVPQVLNKPAAN